MTSPPSDSSPASKVSSAFDLLHPEIQRWIWERGWTELHDVQEHAARPILEGMRDVIITAATAGGKTEAALFPVLTRVAASPAAGIRVLYVSPLKALSA
jgi:ATP-dependent Lhr-like helicase